MGGRGYKNNSEHKKGQKNTRLGRVTVGGVCFVGSWVNKDVSGN